MPRYATFETIEDFEECYRETIVPALRADDGVEVDPATETPPYRWLKANFSGFVERLRRDHDCSPGEFYDEVGLPPDGDGTDGTWPVDHESTVGMLEAYLEELDRDRGRAATTVGPRRSRLRTYVGTYREVHDTGAVVAHLDDPAARPAEIQRAKGAFRVLDDRLGTLASKRKYVSAVQDWYTFLVETGRARYNPAENLRRRFGWDEEPVYDHPALTRQDLRDLLSVADANERFLLLALAGWGLRPVEACELHVDQAVLDPPEGEGDVPYVAFAPGERKNARRTRNTVELLVGVAALRARIRRLDRDPEWSGYLLPSPESADSPITTQTARRWLRDLGERAGVTVDGDAPTPKMGRRTWYRLYRQQRPQIEADTAAVADSQGSADPSVSARNYLDERTRRQARAEAMRDLVRDELAAIFEP